LAELGAVFGTGVEAGAKAFGAEAGVCSFTTPLWPRPGVIFRTWAGCLLVAFEVAGAAFFVLLVVASVVLVAVSW